MKKIIKKMAMVCLIVLTVAPMAVSVAGAAIMVNEIWGFSMTDSKVANSTATTDSRYDVQYDADKAFDNNLTTYWQAATKTVSHWIRCGFETAVSIVKYKLLAVSSPSAPKTWTFEGSNDDSSWTTLDAQTDYTLTISTWNEFAVDNSTTPYLYYRLNIASGPTTEVALYEIELYAPDSVPTPASAMTVKSNGDTHIYGDVTIGTCTADNSATTAGDLYVLGQLSADTVVDRTPYPESLTAAYEGVKSMTGEKGNPEQVDHNRLAPALRVLGSPRKNKIKTGEDAKRFPIFKEEVTTPVVGRNLSAVVSFQNEVIKDLIRRIERLEAGKTGKSR